MSVARVNTKTTKGTSFHLATEKLVGSMERNIGPFNLPSLSIQLIFLF